MAERKGKSGISPNQTFFFERSGRMQLSTSIQSMAFGELVENFLVERTLWKGSKNGEWLLYDIRNLRLIAFNREGKQLGPDLNLLEEQRQGKFAGLIAVFDVGLLPSDFEKAKNNLINAIPFLKKEAVIFVLEAKHQNNNKEWRREVLKQVGVVKANILVSQNDYLIWEGRFPKEHKEKAGVDLTSMNDPIRHNRMQRLWRDMVDSYKRKGFVVVNNEPLLSRLKNSKYIPQDMGYLKEGLGVTVRARCGCVWDIPFKHEWERVEHCPDKDCEGIPSNPEVLYNINGYIRTKDKCFDCRDEGTFKQIIYRIEKRYRNGGVKLQVITFCPHCGIGNAVRHFITVDQSQLRFGD